MENQIKFNKPTVAVHQNGNLELTADWVVQYGDWSFIVPAGFISDGNSVPRIFQPIVPKFGRNTLAGIVHDWLYKSAIVHNGGGDMVEIISQRQADIVRLDFCRWCGVHWIQRMASYLGLRIGGFVAWRRADRIRTTHTCRDYDRLCEYLTNQANSPERSRS